MRSRTESSFYAELHFPRQINPKNWRLHRIKNEGVHIIPIRSTPARITETVLFQTCEIFDCTYHLAGIAVFIVIPGYDLYLCHAIA
jgi:hypothetical protein